MNAYERIMEVIRKQGKKRNLTELQLASVGEQKEIHVGDLKLDSDDYIKSEGVSLQKGDTVLIYQIEDNEYIVICKVVNGDVSV